MSYTLSKEGYSFHTFELKKSITYVEYYTIKDSIYTIAKATRSRVFQKASGNYIECEIWSGNGLTIFLHNNGNMPPHFRLVVNPRKILDDYENIGIFHYTIENMEVVVSFINEVLLRLNSGYLFEDMTLSRIDLCVNINFDDPILCNEYIRLLRKCAIPSNYKRTSFSSNESNYIEKNKRSFRAYKHDVTVTIYDKIYQLAQADRLTSGGPIPKGLIRIETSLERAEILSVGRLHLHKVEITNQEYFQLFGEKSKEIMKGYLYSFFPSGIYVRYDLLKKFIISINVKEKTRKRMLFILEKASSCDDLNKAIEKLLVKFELSQKKCDYILKTFEQFGVYPVAIPNISSSLALPGIRSILGYEGNPLQEEV